MDFHMRMSDLDVTSSSVQLRYGVCPRCASRPTFFTYWSLYGKRSTFFPSCVFGFMLYGDYCQTLFVADNVSLMTVLEYTVYCS